MKSKNSTELFTEITEFFNAQDRYSFPYDTKVLTEVTDSNGLYILFESGETYNGYNRITRVGNHRVDYNFLKRLENHFLSENQRKSILRKHIGRCLLNKEDNPYLVAWDKKFDEKKDKAIYKDRVDLDYEEGYEIKISSYIRKNISFTVIPKVFNKDERYRIEEGLIALFAQSRLNKSSNNWLGLSHPDKRIRDCHLWNIHYINRKPLNKNEFTNLILTKFGK